MKVFEFNISEKIEEMTRKDQEKPIRTVKSRWKAYQVVDETGLDT
jgi:hypothetical protein